MHPQELRYQIEIEDVHAHTFRITLTVPQPAARQVVSLPAWIPGSYLLREFARQLSGLRAQQGGVEVRVDQIDKATWQLACTDALSLQLSYRVHAFDNSVRAAFLDAQRGFFNNTSLCLRVHGAEQQAHRLCLVGLPDRWQVATAMPAADGGWVAGNFDELVDHPFELGRFWQGEFGVAGLRHRIVVSGALPVFDGARLLADVERICAAQHDFWGGARPFEHYTFFLNAVDDGYGGLEHRASTALIAARRDLPRAGETEISEGYLRLLGLISHEYFHSWNVKRLKPAEFATLDYTRENYTELLWFFEGFTSYFDELMLLRAGLIDAQRYLKLLAATVSGVLATPGRKLQSVAEASFDAWVKHYRPDENSPNSTISYYGKGALVALALDLRLRALGGSGIDEVMRSLWQRSAGGPVTEVDIMASVAECGDADTAQVLFAWVHGTDDLPLPALLAAAGVHWRADKPSVAQRLGLRVSESALTGVHVKQVLAGSAAQRAGFCAADEVIACNGWRLRRLDDVSLSLAAGQTSLQFLVSRDQRLIELRLAWPMDAFATPVLLSLADAPAHAGRDLRHAWLGT